MSTFHADINSGGRGEVLLDGEPLSGTSSFVLSSKAGERTKLELNIAILNATIDAEVDVLLRVETARTLIRLGWTPPACVTAELETVGDGLFINVTGNPGADA